VRPERAGPGGVPRRLGRPGLAGQPGLLTALQYTSSYWMFNLRDTSACSWTRCGTLEDVMKNQQVIIS
jgi:hypothetical protein